jgi:hypothetical protein
MINSKLQDIYCVYIEKVNNKIDIHDILYRVLHFLYYSQALFFLIIHITFYEQSIIISTVHSKYINDHTLRSDIFLPKCPKNVRQIWESTSPTIWSDYLVGHFGLGMDFIFVNVIQYLDKGKFEHKKQPLWEKLIIFISSVLIPKLIFTFLKPKFSSTAVFYVQIYLCLNTVWH